ncbi:CPBP family intramembrane metalloprotease [Candidatus Saccharibacteria bacterium]|nr:CPBP family intramembrane metalloprotease [Candidatus Saccharibacteria bacterium]MBQ9016840.1 CPBP family intramembrane metalloprotease [Candidatus Saccharibacteria bacterium]
MPDTKVKKPPLGFKIALAIGLVAWVWLCVYLAKYLSYHGFKWLIMTFHLETSTILQSIYSVVIYLLAILIMLGVPALLRKYFPKLKAYPLLEKPSREELGLKNLPTWTDILLSPIGFLIQYALGALLVTFFTNFSWFNATEVQPTGYSDLISTGDKILAFLIIAVLAPIVEEIIFRGFLYGRLRKYLNLPASILLVSLLFAVLHEQWNVGVNVFATSLVLCALREVTGTIYSGMLVHILKNAVAFYLLFIAL